MIPTDDRRTTLLIRADANATIGAGHVMRTIALGQAYLRKDAPVVVASIECPAGLTDRLHAEGFTTIHLTADQRGGADDLAATIAAARSCNAAWVVLDGYAFDAAFEQGLVDAGLHVLALDDHARVPAHAAQLVLDQNHGSQAAWYTPTFPEREVMAGQRYTLLRREFVRAAQEPKTIAERGTNVLVTFGGADPERMTQRVLTALAGLPVHIRAVIGAADPQYDELAATIDPAQVTLLRNVPDMTPHMAWADMAISAGGSTVWELLALGVPAMVHGVASNQRGVVHAVVEAGLCLELPLPAEKMRLAVTDLLNDRDRRAGMAQRGHEQMDGYGAERVVARMRAGDLGLRLARAEDADAIWRLANDPVVRAMSFLTASIPWEEHLRWFTARLEDPATVFYVLEEDGRFAGNVRFVLDGDTARISIALAEALRGRGLGAGAIHRACRELFATTSVELAEAFIRPTNPASLKAFRAADFDPSHRTLAHGEDAWVYTLPRSRSGA